MTELEQEGYDAGPIIYAGVKAIFGDVDHVKLIEAMMEESSKIIDPRDAGLQIWCREQLQGSMQA